MILVHTHDGRFHADETFAAAIVRMAHDPEEVMIIRTRGEVPDADYHLDVGREYDPARGRLDHHQPEFDLTYPDGVGYATAGITWLLLGRGICPRKAAFDQVARYLKYLDAHDVGHEVNPLSMSVAFMNPPAGVPATREERDYLFSKAVDWAETALEGAIIHAEAVADAAAVISQTLRKSTPPYVVFQAPLQWGAYDFPASFLWVVVPTSRGFRAKAIPVSPFARENRVNFPQAWCGLTNRELEKAAGVPGLLFCHRGGYLLEADSLQSLLCALDNAQS